MREVFIADVILLVILTGMLIKEEVKCYRRRKERLKRGDVLEFN